MSSANSAFSQDILPQGHATVQKTPVPLNEILKTVLQEMQPQIQRISAIVRCANLPQVEGHQEPLVRLFRNLVSMILASPPGNSKLFFYIGCEEHDGELEPHITERIKNYLIKFHTNITTDDSWKIANQPVLEACASILADHGAVFTVNQVQNSGCIFSIAIPGKPS